MAVRNGSKRSVFGAGRGWGGGGARTRPKSRRLSPHDSLFGRAFFLRALYWRQRYLEENPEQRSFPTLIRTVEKLALPVYKPTKFVKITPKGKTILKPIITPIITPIKKMGQTATWLQKYGIWVAAGLVLLAVSE